MDRELAKVLNALVYGYRKYDGDLSVKHPVRVRKIN